DKTIWCYTGYLFDKEIRDTMFSKYPYTKELVSYFDVMVDGKYVEKLKDLNLRFRGSSNQRIIDVKKSLTSNTLVLWNN
ncbi:MAG: 4Fe-4S cluster-binding domain-containing protein, partial [Erysipelotrichaceae bacterium]|nr:4Fe-4S cluster-binding domain-containing protein [Erysipelotrichaceae bacterium]